MMVAAKLPRTHNLVEAGHVGVALPGTYNLVVAGHVGAALPGTHKLVGAAHVGAAELPGERSGSAWPSSSKQSPTGRGGLPGQLIA